MLTRQPQWLLLQNSLERLIRGCGLGGDSRSGLWASLLWQNRTLFSLSARYGHGVFDSLRHFRVIPQGFLVDVLGIGGNGFPLRLGCGPVGFQLVAEDTAADGLARLAFSKLLSLVTAFHAHAHSTSWIFPCKLGFLNWSAYRIGL